MNYSSKPEDLEKLRKDLEGMTIGQVDNLLQELCPIEAPDTPDFRKVWGIFSDEYSRRGVPFPA